MKFSLTTKHTLYAIVCKIKKIYPSTIKAYNILRGERNKTADTSMLIKRIS